MGQGETCSRNSIGLLNALGEGITARPKTVPTKTCYCWLTWGDQSLGTGGVRGSIASTVGDYRAFSGCGQLAVNVFIASKWPKRVKNL